MPADAVGGSCRPRRAPVFAFTIVATTAVSLVIIIGLGIPPVKLLVIARVTGGIATPVGLIARMLLSRDRRTVEDDPIGSRLYAAGWE